MLLIWQTQQTLVLDKEKLVETESVNTKGEPGRALCVKTHHMCSTDHYSLTTIRTSKQNQLQNQKIKPTPMWQT